MNGGGGDVAWCTCRVTSLRQRQLTGWTLVGGQWVCSQCLKPSKAAVLMRGKRRRSHATRLVEGMGGCWAECSCGWKSEMHDRPEGVQNEWDQHLCDANPLLAKQVEKKTKPLT